VHWQLVRTHLLGEDTEWGLAGDEVVVTKSGKQTYGLGRFFSSLYGKTVPGLCFLNLSLLNVERGCSHTLRLEPMVKEATDSSPNGKKPGKKKTGQKQSSANRTASPAQGTPQGQSQSQPSGGDAIALFIVCTGNDPASVTPVRFLGCATVRPL